MKGFTVKEVSVEILSCFEKSPRADPLSGYRDLSCLSSLVSFVPEICNCFQNVYNGSYKSFTQILIFGYVCATYNATEPPPKKGSRYSSYSPRLGKYGAIFLIARDLPPGYLRGVFRDVATVITTIRLSLFP